MAKFFSSEDGSRPVNFDTVCLGKNFNSLEITLLSQRLQVYLYCSDGDHYMCSGALYSAQWKLHINNVQKRRRVLWDQAHLKWTDAQWKRILWSDESTFKIFIEIMDVVFFGPKKHPDCYQRKVLNGASVMVPSFFGMYCRHPMK